jgi:hypothetical protein
MKRVTKLVNQSRFWGDLQDPMGNFAVLLVKGNPLPCLKGIGCPGSPQGRNAAGKSPCPGAGGNATQYCTDTAFCSYTLREK